MGDAFASDIDVANQLYRNRVARNMCGLQIMVYIAESRAVQGFSIIEKLLQIAIVTDKRPSATTAGLSDIDRRLGFITDAF